MASSSKRKQTMAKMARERSLQEKREAKQQKKEDRKRAAAERDEAIAAGTYVPAEDGDEEQEVLEG